MLSTQGQDAFIDDLYITSLKGNILPSGETFWRNISPPIEADPPLSWACCPVLVFHIIDILSMLSISPINIREMQNGKCCRGRSGSDKS